MHCNFKTMTINEELKQTKFISAQQKLMINIMFTSNFLNAQGNKLFRQHKLTSQQFNVLRILRGQKDKAISVKDIEGRMLDRSSNVSRLIDKLHDKKYVERLLSSRDRRRVDIKITEAGLAILALLDDDITEMEKRFENLFTDEQANLVNDMLDKIRTN